MDILDVVIVGAGPAGSTAARLLKQNGLRLKIIDKANFPRFKPCAGWITDGVLELAGIDKNKYAQEHTLQPITGFILWDRKGKPHITDYGETVSYGIIRTEFDTYLIERNNLEVHEGLKINSVEFLEDRVRLSGSDSTGKSQTIETHLVIGAGGHFCPVAKAIGNPTTDTFTVGAIESEFKIDEEFKSTYRVKPGMPEIFFTEEINGYGWYIAKGNYLNIGIGSIDKPQVRKMWRNFLKQLVSMGKIPADTETIASVARGHFYKFYPAAPRKLVHHRALLIGDSAGLAYNVSGEGIKPAIISAHIAAETVKEIVDLASGDIERSDFSEEALNSYDKRIVKEFGNRNYRSNRDTNPKASPFLKFIFNNILLGTRVGRKYIIEKFFLKKRNDSFIDA